MKRRRSTKRTKIRQVTRAATAIRMSTVILIRRGRTRFTVRVTVISMTILSMDKTFFIELKQKKKNRRNKRKRNVKLFVRSILLMFLGENGFDMRTIEIVESSTVEKTRVNNSVGHETSRSFGEEKNVGPIFDEIRKTLKLFQFVAATRRRRNDGEKVRFGQSSKNRVEKILLKTGKMFSRR